MREVEGVKDCMKWRGVTRARQTLCLGNVTRKLEVISVEV